MNDVETLERNLYGFVTMPNANLVSRKRLVPSDAIRRALDGDA